MKKIIRNINDEYNDTDYLYFIDYYFKTNNYHSLYLFNNIDTIDLNNSDFLIKVYYKDDIQFNILINYFPVYKLEKITIITFGTFDLFHYGHQNLFNRIKLYGNNIIVGVSSDKLNKIKNKISYQNEQIRLKYIKTLPNITKVFLEESLEDKNNYIKKYNANLLIMGDDWKDKFDWVDCLVIYLERTPNISSTILRNNIIHTN